MKTIGKPNWIQFNYFHADSSKPAPTYSVASSSSFFLLWASSLVWLPIASEMTFGNQKPGFSRDGARSRTKGSLRVTSTPSKIHNFIVASPWRPKENQPKPAIAMSMQLTSQLDPDTFTSFSRHVPSSAARSPPIGGWHKNGVKEN